MSPHSRSEREPDDRVSYVRIAGIIAASATALSLIRIAQIRLGAFGQPSSVDWPTIIRSQIGFWYGWAIVALPLVCVLRALPLGRMSVVTVIAVHAGLGAAALLLHPVLDMLLRYSLGAPLSEVSITTRYGITLISFLMNDLQVFAAIVGLTHASRYYRRYRERELAATKLAAQLSHARLVALRAQLNPHFLFNALNTVAMLSRRGASADVVKMVAGLSELLRVALDDNRTQLVPLREEMSFVERYLAIEAVRFQDRLRVHIDIDPAAETALVPTLMLQPLVENAIRHGISRSASAGQLRVTAVRRGDKLEVEVRDDGPGLLAGNGTGSNDPGRTRLGLRNTRERLEQHYGSAWSLELHDAQGTGAVARVVLPFREASQLIAAAVP